MSAAVFSGDQHNDSDGGSNGQLRQRGNVWWVRYYRNGKRYEESARTNKKGKAKNLLQLRDGDGAKGIPVTPKIGRLRFEEAAADVVTDTPRPSSSTPAFATAT